MAGPRPTIHGRDHSRGGTDPVYHGWESVGAGPDTFAHRVLLAVFDGAGTPLVSGLQGDVSLPFDATITEWVLLADTTGSVEVDIWKDTLAAYPPTSSDSITAGAKPAIVSGVTASSSTLTGWTTAITAGDTLRFNVDSASGVKRVTLALTLEV